LGQRFAALHDEHHFLGIGNETEAKGQEGKAEEIIMSTHCGLKAAQGMKINCRFGLFNDKNGVDVFNELIMRAFFKENQWQIQGFHCKSN
jgi:hypothetical protein